MDKKRAGRSFRITLRWILWVLIVQLLLINISAAFYAYRLTHFYSDGREREPLSGKNALARTWRLFTGPRYQKSAVGATPVLAYDTVLLKTEKGIFLDSWYIPADSLARGTVVLFHGITTSKASLLAEAAEFHFQGFHVLLVDFRGHGNSGGRTTTMGIRESEDVRLAYEYVAGLGEKNIFLYGSSMGAVAVMKAVSEGSMNLSGIILEMPFASLQTHLQARARIEGFSGWVEKPFSFFVTAWISLERWCNGYGHRSTTYAAKISCPVLVQWGSSDRIVKRSETEDIYRALASSRKELVVYEGAGHGSLLQGDEGKWQEKVGRFLSDNGK
jgi:alpha-beta hydrolase superfamily lysophospholipase